MVKRLLAILSLMLLSTAAAAQQADSLSAYVDRNEVSRNDVFTVTIRVDAALSNNPPSLEALDEDFERVNMARSSNYTFLNGIQQSWNEYRISLRPRTTGTLTIPSFEIGGLSTDPIEITVSDAPGNPVNQNDDFLLTTLVDKEEVYVQEQLIYTIKLHFRTSFDQGAQLTSPQIENAVTQRLGNDNNYQEIIDGVRYNVIERNFVIFPQSSGDMEIPGISFNATVGGRRGGFSNFFSNESNNNSGRQVDLTSENHTITVNPTPAEYPADATWLPARSVTVEEEWSGPTDNLTVGESVTRNLTITAEGLSSSLLTDFTYQEMAGLKFYPDQPTRDDVTTESGVIGTRTEGTAIVASEPGDYTLPAVEIPWWNTETNALEYATLPPRTLSIVSGSFSDSTEPAQPAGEIADTDSGSGGGGEPALINSGGLRFWIAATAVLAIAWLISTMMWVRNRQLLKQGAVLDLSAMASATTGTDTAAPDADSAFKVFKRCCKQGQLLDVKRALINWAQARYEDRNILTLEDMKRHIRDDAINDLLDGLENSLYSPAKADRSYQVEELLKAVTALNKRARKQSSRDRQADYTLPPLYRN